MHIWHTLKTVKYSKYAFDFLNTTLMIMSVKDTFAQMQMLGQCIASAQHAVHNKHSCFAVPVTNLQILQEGDRVKLQKVEPLNCVINQVSGYKHVNVTSINMLSKNLFKR